MYTCTDVTSVTTLSYVIFERRETRSASERIMESRSVGITTAILSRGSPGGSPGRYYVKVVADEESRWNDGMLTDLLLSILFLSLSLSLSLSLQLPDSNDGLHARWKREYYLYHHITRSIETEVLRNLADLIDTGLESDRFKMHENWHWMWLAHRLSLEPFRLESRLVINK